MKSTDPEGWQPLSFVRAAGETLQGIYLGLLSLLLGHAHTASAAKASLHIGLRASTRPELETEPPRFVMPGKRVVDSRQQCGGLAHNRPSVLFAGLQAGLDEPANGLCARLKELPA